MKETDRIAPHLSLRKNVEIHGVGGFIGGALQTAVEGLKVIDGDTDKFPNGWSDFRLFEEFSEGALSVMVGMLAGKLIYKSLCKLGIEYNPVGEFVLMAIGGTVGYHSMILLGGYLHYKLGVSDVKWGPFK